MSLCKKTLETSFSLSTGREGKPCEDTNEEQTIYKPGGQVLPEANSDGILTLHLTLPPELKK